MKEFTDLLRVADTLLGPKGCPWDQQQTLSSLAPYLLEEMHELLEALDEKDGHKITEEMGDLIYSIIFIAKVGEKEGLVELREALRLVGDKLRRRHPHVFGDVQAFTAAEVMHNWEVIKRTEKGKEQRQSILDGIPPTLPALARAQRVIQKMRRVQRPQHEEGMNVMTELELGERLWALIRQADMAGIDAEGACRRMSQKYELEFRQEERAPERIE